MADLPQNIEIFDRRRLRLNRNRAAAHIADTGFLADWAAKNLIERLSDIKRDFPLALLSGLRTNPDIAKNIKADHLIRTDMADRLVQNHNANLQSDPEYLPFKQGSLDLAINILDLHSINDLPGALIQIRRALKPDGLFVAALFGGETLYELRESLSQAEIQTRNGISPRIFPFADKQQMGALMQRAGFALPVVDSEIITVTYASLPKLLHDVRLMGEGNIIAGRDKKYPGRKLFEKAAEHYTKNFSEEDGRLRASFEIIFVLGWAPHESQQQPLRPGSAQNRLADALGTGEYIHQSKDNK